LTNRLKAKLAGGGHAIGCFVTTTSAENAEVLALAGLDFLLIDQEHGSGGPSETLAQIRAISGAGASSMVRVPANDPVHFKRALDAGADAVLCPMVESREEAQSVVAACLFPPLGARGTGGGVRATRYGLDDDYWSRAAEDVLIAVQIETCQGVERIAEIAATPGVDMLFIGPRDLSASMGKLNQFQDPEVLDMVARAEARIIASGKYLASVLYAGRSVSDMLRSRYRLLVVGSDTSYLIRGAKDALKAAEV
jgi:4-hydroxy-2-oxoheptanedioate aldolase